MSRRSIATPCPLLTTTQDYRYQGLDETTTTLNFTTAFDASFRNVKPKRLKRNSVQFAIHGDSVATSDPRNVEDKSLSKPARRLTGSFVKIHSFPHTDSASEAVIETSSSHSQHVAHRISQAPRRLPSRLSIVPETTVKEIQCAPVRPSKREGCSINATRPLRRGTVYIPEDTTMPSMYMGIFSPLKSLEPVPGLAAEPTIDLSEAAAQMAAKRGRSRRLSVIDAAPRRAPLQTSTKPLQDSTLVVDRPGQGPGKENQPPGMTRCERQMLDLDLVWPTPTDANAIRSKHESIKARRKSVHPGSCMLPRTNTQSSLQSVVNQQVFRCAPKRAWNSGLKTASSRSIAVKPKYSVKPSQLSSSQKVVVEPRVPSRFVVPAINAAPVQCNPLIISEDISNAELYEDNWLGHQEIALTQLVNKLFMCAQSGRHPKRLPQSLTQDLLRNYSTDNVSLLHKRLQAALLYGALSMPQELLDQGESWYKDLGRKEKFVRLWLDNYDLQALEAGLEVVTGRSCRSQTSRASGDISPSRSVSQKRLSSVIESFLIRNEDSRPGRDCRQKSTWSYQRTMLRSLMLMKALDMIKTGKLPSCDSGLFLPTATYKSSTDILHAFFQMMNPSAGDPVRALGHIDYHISQVQYPLEEFDYIIDNLATDLRDGVRLTRLVELLLYPTASEHLDKEKDVDATTTIVLPTGDPVEFRDGQDWPLSQHLKFPCISRATRLWNVQIALSAVANVRGAKTMVEGITAEDVVDGFREKTIRLLWALLGKCGLASLIDWEDVEWETRRLRLRLKDDNQASHNDIVDDFDGYGDGTSPAYSFEKCRTLLKNWVRVVAASQGVQVHNFTTSFADGRIFQSIVDVYEPMLSTPSSPITDTARPCGQSQPTKTSSLPERLMRLGCSRQFAGLFASLSSPSHKRQNQQHASATSEGRGGKHIFDREFVIASLAFLCSRLLAPTKAHRAAVVIQRRWRLFWTRHVQQKRNDRRREVALACAEYVREKKAGEEQEESSRRCGREVMSEPAREDHDNDNENENDDDNGGGERRVKGMVVNGEMKATTAGEGVNVNTRNGHASGNKLAEGDRHGEGEGDMNSQITSDIWLSL